MCSIEITVFIIVEEERKEAGRHDTGTKGGANRPTGKSSARDSTGINPKTPIEPNSPHIPTP